MPIGLLPDGLVRQYRGRGCLEKSHSTTRAIAAHCEPAGNTDLKCVCDCHSDRATARDRHTVQGSDDQDRRPTARRMGCVSRQGECVPVFSLDIRVTRSSRPDSKRLDTRFNQQPGRNRQRVPIRRMRTGVRIGEWQGLLQRCRTGAAKQQPLRRVLDHRHPGRKLRDFRGRPRGKRATRLSLARKRKAHAISGTPERFAIG